MLVRGAFLAAPDILLQQPEQGAGRNGGVDRFGGLEGLESLIEDFALVVGRNVGFVEFVFGALRVALHRGQGAAVGPHQGVVDGAVGPAQGVIGIAQPGALQVDDAGFAADDGAPSQETAGFAGQGAQVIAADGEEEQGVAADAGYAGARFPQDFQGLRPGVVGFGLAGGPGELRRQGHQPHLVGFRHLRVARRQHDEVGAAVPRRFQPPENFPVHYGFGQGAGAVDGDFVEVFFRMEEVAVVGAVEVVEGAGHRVQGLVVGRNALAGHGDAQVNLLPVEAPQGAAGGAAQKDGAGDAAGGAPHLPERRGTPVEAVGAGVGAVGFRQHRPPVAGQQPGEFAGQLFIGQRQVAGQQQRRLIVVQAQAVDALRHQPQHGAGALKAGDGRPVFVEAVENLRVDGIAGFQQFQVVRFGHALGIFAAGVAIHPVKGFAHGVPGFRLAHFLEEAAAHHFIGFVDGQRLPNRLDAPQQLRQLGQGFQPGRAAGLGFAFRQRHHQADIGAAARRLRERLDKGNHAVPIVVPRVADIGHQLIDEEDAGADIIEQPFELRAAGGRAAPGRFADEFVGFLLPQLVGHFAPQRVERVAVGGGALAVCDVQKSADEHRHLPHPDGAVGVLGFVEEAPNFGGGAGIGARLLGRVQEGVGVVDQVVEGDEAVSLAAAEAGFGLHHRVAALPAQPPDGVDQQRAQAGGDVGVLEEADRVAVLGIGGAPVIHLLQIGGEFGLLVAALSHIVVGADDPPPGFQMGGDAPGAAAARWGGFGAGR